MTNKEREQNDEIGSSPVSDYVETRLDGSFVVPNLKPRRCEIQPLHVLGDTTGLLVLVPEMRKSEAAGLQSQSN